MARKQSQKRPSYKEQIKALTKISNAINSGLYLEDTLKLIVAVTAQAMRSNICSLHLVDREKQELVIRATQSMSQEYNKKPPLKIGEGIAGKVVLQNKPIMVKDITQEKEYKYQDIAKKEGLCSLLCVPLSLRNGVIGVLNSYTSYPHEFTETEIDVLKSIANLASVAIENSDLAARTKVIQEELDARKKIDRAKGILMRDEKLTEEESYLKIKKYSMDSRKSMKEIAEAIILTDEMKK
ncbi:MAG: GAF domain-containing protein [bacterium]|nr:GAF domain-containing protein [bacterium]